MNNQNSDFKIKILTAQDLNQDSDSKLFQDLKTLLQDLSSRFTGDELNLEHLTQNLRNPNFFLIGAFTKQSENQKLIGIALISEVYGLVENKLVLEDFVVSKDFRGQGVADQIWQQIIQLMKDKKITHLDFTSKPSRTAAHKFYLSHGAKIRETAPFRFELLF